MSEPLIRTGEESDVPRLTEIYNYYIEKTAVSFDIDSHDPELRKTSWFINYAVTGKYRLFVAECEGQIVGYSTSSRFRERAAYATSVETSIYLDHRFFQRGIGTKLYRALFDALEKEAVHRAYGGVTLPNPSSVALHKKFGFREVGVYREVGYKFGKYYDVCWFEKALDG